MNANKRKALAEQLVALTARLKDADALPESVRKLFIQGGGSSVGLAGPDADSFDEMGGTLLQQGGWIDKYSEHFVANLLRKFLEELHGDNNSTKAERLLEDADKEYQAYQKKHTVLVPLAGIVWEEAELKIGKVSFKQMTPDDLRRRLGAHADSQFTQVLTKEIANSTVTESLVLAEPIRAKEIAVEETRRALDLLRYSITFIIPVEYKRLGMNVGIKGDFGEGDVLALILPSPDDQSIALSSVRDGPSLPFHVYKETIEKFQESGVTEVAAILEKAENALSDFERTLLRGIHWFGNALCQKEPENELLNLVTCLEAFLTPDDNNPIGTAIAEGVALLLEKALEERKKLKKKVKDVYAKRSGVSHGGKKAVLDSELSELREVTRKLIRRMISHNKAVQSKKQLLEMIEEMKLG
jgi:hypothetical protein